MKKVYFFLLSVCLFPPSVIYAQDLFTVIKVSGSIIIERTGSSLGTGTSFAQSENLLFKIPESRAAVINPERGRFLITSENSSTFRTSKSVFLPPASKVSMRSVNENSGLSDLKKHFEGNYLILNNIRLKIDTTVYPMRSNRFFYLTYDYQAKAINKKLAFIMDTLVINKNELLTVNGEIIPDSAVKELKLMYLVTGETYTTALICSFFPIFPDYQTLGSEIKILAGQLSAKTYNEKMVEISSFVREFYGKFDEPNLQRWLSQNYGLK